MTPITADNLSRLRGIRHGFFGRLGGVSTAPWGTLNAAFRVGDRPERVEQNRRRICFALGTDPGSLFTVHQVHGARAAPIDATSDAVASREIEADVLFTTRAGVLLGILTADCAPILLATEDASAVAAAHAGWRGAAAGVVGAAVSSLRSVGADPHRLVAAIGPCIGPDRFDVRRDVVDAFAGRQRGCFVRKNADQWRFDLAQWLKGELRDRGVHRTEVVRFCTYSHPDSFFSHRRATREGRANGGQLAVIGIT